MSEHGISADDVDSVECAVSPAVEDYLKFPLPETKLQAKYSMQFCVALALVEGKVTLSAITEERVKDPRIVDLMKRVTMSVSPELAKLGYAPEIAPYGCTVTIILKNGSRLVRRVDQVPWNPAEPPSWDELVEKYRSCWDGVFADGRIDESLDIVGHLEDAKAKDIERLMTLVRSDSR
jgi:2-methylcitrate dehydratase PrpD